MSNTATANSRVVMPIHHGTDSANSAGDGTDGGENHSTMLANHQAQGTSTGTKIAATRKLHVVKTVNTPTRNASGQPYVGGGVGKRRCTFRKNAHNIGVSVNAEISEKNTATLTVTPNWKKNLPIVPFMK